MLNKKTQKKIRRHKKIRSRIKGSGSCPRLCVFRSDSHIYAQVIDDEKGATLLSVSDKDSEVKKKLNSSKEDSKGFTKVDNAKIIGKILAERAKSKKIGRVVFDRGGFVYTGRVKALAEGAREGGLNF
jgi:large subunit ribosomal protein L18